MDGFREAIDTCRLRDMGFKGNWFTWQRGVSGFLASEEWCTQFPNAEVIHLPIYKSDHAPILLKATVGGGEWRRDRAFYFEAHWLSNSECEKIVERTWKDYCTEPVHARIGKRIKEKEWKLKQRENGDNEAWRVIWSIEGPPKLKHFLWRGCKGGLAVMERLYKRHIVQSMECRVCGAEVESVIHSLFECHYAKEIWRSSMVADIITRAPSSSMGDILVWVRERVEKKEMGCFGALCWAAWHCRNTHIF
ncbi:hypothetical protein RDABS01_016158 [Bienertia sinuspersici]